MNFEPVIGLEVHAQLLTRSKMFCSCSADYAGAAPNTHVCPICLGLPGSLPVINKIAVEYTVLTGLAFHCEIPEYSKFDRKNYPYPDLMKGYQISQYDLPLCRNGYVLIDSSGETQRIGIRRVHLEEDTAKVFHVDGSSLVDVNRAGVPLMEIVSEPEMHSGEDARLYAAKLRQILRYLGVSSGNMEKGALRVEPNISLRPVGSTSLSQARVEIKNLNSLRALAQGIEYEIARQNKILEAGGSVEQQTMGWDEARGVTVPQRSKEEAHDYRYFPEPDLPRLHLAPSWVDEIRGRLPELPDEKRERLMRVDGLSAYDSAVITSEKEIAGYYERAVAPGHRSGITPKSIANWVTGELFRLMKDSGTDLSAVKIAPEQIPALIALVQAGTISTTIAKQVFDEMYRTGKAPEDIVREKGWAQIADADALGAIADRVIVENPKPVQEYLAGKQAILKFLVGQMMKATKGQANPTLAAELLATKLAAMRASNKMKNP